MSDEITKDILFYKILPLLSYYDLYTVQFLSRQCRSYGVENFRQFFKQSIGLHPYSNTATIQFCAFYLFVFQSGYCLTKQQEGYKSYMTATDAFTHFYLKKQLLYIRQESTNWTNQTRAHLTLIEPTKDGEMYWSWYQVAKHSYTYFTLPEPIISNRDRTIYPIITLLHQWVHTYRSPLIMNQTRRLNCENVFGYPRRKRKQPEFEDVPIVKKKKSQKTLQKERFNQTHIRPPEYHTKAVSGDPP